VVSLLLLRREIFLKVALLAVFRRSKCMAIFRILEGRVPML